MKTLIIIFLVLVFFGVFIAPLIIIPYYPELGGLIGKCVGIGLMVSINIFLIILSLRGLIQKRSNK